MLTDEGHEVVAIAIIGVRRGLTGELDPPRSQSRTRCRGPVTNSPSFDDDRSWS